MVPGLSRLLPRLSGLQRMIHQWRTDSPVELAAQLSQHQQDVHDALLRHASNVWPRLEQRVVSPGSYGALAGDMLVCDTAAGNVTVTLPEATRKTIGAICGVLKLSPQNEVRVFVPRGTLDGTSPLRIAPVGLRLFVATVYGWWSVSPRSLDTFEAEISGSASVGNPLTIDSPVLSAPGFSRLSGNTVVRVPYPARWRVDVFGGVTHNNASGPVSVGLALQMAASTVAQFLGHRTSGDASHRVPVSGHRTLPITDPATQTLRVVAAGSGGAVAAGNAPVMNWITISYAGEL